MPSLFTIGDLSAQMIQTIMNVGIFLDANRKEASSILTGKKVAALFSKPSLRTKAAFCGATEDCGGRVHYYAPDEIGLGSRESPEDVANTLQAMKYDIIAARVYEHEHLAKMAQASSLPVINLLSDTDHPTQALADATTLMRRCGQITGLNVAYVGDGNNVAASFVQVMLALGANVSIATLGGKYALKPEAVQTAQRFGSSSGAKFCQCTDPYVAVQNAEVLYTDVWASMHQKNEIFVRTPIFAPFQVNDQLLAAASKSCFVMHCLPAIRGWEVAASVIDGPRSIVWEQAADRLVVARSLLVWASGVRNELFVQ